MVSTALRPASLILGTATARITTIIAVTTSSSMREKPPVCCFLRLTHISRMTPRKLQALNADPFRPEPRSLRRLPGFVGFDREGTQRRQLPLSPSRIRLIGPIATECYFARIETEAMLFSHSSWSLPLLPLAVIVYFSFSMGTGGFSIFMSTRPRSMPGS